MPESQTIPQLLQEQAARYGSREAVVDGRRRCTYSQLLDDSNRLARGLLALGLKRGDHVAILMGNRVEWLLSFLAIQQIGAISVGLNTWSSAREMAYTLAHAEVRCLITTDRLRRLDFRALLGGLDRSELSMLQHTVWLAADPAAPVQLDAAAGEIAWDEVLQLGERIAQADVDAAAQATRPADVAMLLYTSGSTAAPKGILLQHGQWVRNSFHIGERQHVTHEDRLWLVVSLFWSFGIVNAVPNLLTHGGCVVLQESFDAAEALALIERERCTILYGTPNIVQALWEHPARADRDLSSLRSGAMIGTPAQVMRAVEIGVHGICNVYGLSETYGNCTVADADDPLEVRLQSVGRPLPDVTIRICDLETGAPLAADEVGEIRVKGPLVKEYFKDPQKTAEAFDADGFFMTGDLGMLDADGRMYYKGRTKEMVKSGGINIAPAEVEEVLMRHPGVRTAYVIGVPHSTLDEALVAIIVAEAGSEPGADELKRFCAAEMAAYKVPHRFHFTTESQLPLTTTGKVQKMKLHTILR
ncbi:class I adenylate-forming enzyme family protein [Piscinibacter sakaiensis]|uniref:class I adenylate-forming enzyme family protein n=1 Tax=Piscinibacter sakaiensis TaxID=1547922 RepID=UPI003AAA5A97